MMRRWISGAAGVLLLVAAGVSALSIQRFLRSAVSADAVVTSLTAGGSHPRLRFHTATGQEITFSAGGLIFGYQVGQHARVLYHADTPQESASLAAPGSLWFLPLMLAFIGMGGILVPVSEAFF